MASRFKFDDRRMETIMGRLLQVGVLLASAVVLVGGVLYVRGHLGSAVDYRSFAGEPAELRSGRGLLPAIDDGRSGSPDSGWVCCC